MPKTSAGILMYRRVGGQIQVLLAHPGGPLFQHKDDGVWTVPKGEAEPGEDLLRTAQREFTEETGFVAAGPFVPLGTVTLKSGKIVHAWASAGDVDCSKRVSNTFLMQWPPKSGKYAEFEEVDQVEYFTIKNAKLKLKGAQIPFLERLVESLRS